jgi:ribosome-binding protein aMBF1 (putative translation factor)
MPTDPLLDTSLHERRRARRMHDPEYRQAYERAAREVAQTDHVIRELDSLRVSLGMSKAELARRIDRNASSIRRLFTASNARPELPLVAAIADALGAEVRVVSRRGTAKAASKAPAGPKRT